MHAPNMQPVRIRQFPVRRFAECRSVAELRQCERCSHLQAIREASHNMLRLSVVPSNPQLVRRVIMALMGLGKPGIRWVTTTSQVHEIHQNVILSYAGR